MVKPKGTADRVTIKIPRELYANLAELIKGTGFRSVTDFVIHVLRDLAAGGKLSVQEAAPGLSIKEVELIRQRLKALGYIE